MFSDWALWDLEDYRELLVEVAVRSGLFDALQEGGEISPEHFDLASTRRILQALSAEGIVREISDWRFQWTGPRPDARMLYRWDAARRWLGLAERIRKSALAVPETIATPLLEETAPWLSEWMVRVLQPKPGTRWLDVGGGQGTWARRLLQAGAQVVLAERPGVVKGFETQDGLGLWEGDIFERLPDSGPFDGISLVRFIEDWDRPRIEHLLEGLSALLSETGSLYVVGYFRDRAHWGALFDVNVMASSVHGTAYEVGTLKQAAEASGLQATVEIGAEFDTYTLMGFQKTHGPHQR